MRLIYSLLTYLLLVVPTFSTTAIAKSEEADLVSKGAWVRSTIATQKATAMYLSLRNTTSETIELVGVESDIASHSMMHKTIDEDGVAKMRHQDSIMIEPGKKVIFEQGGLHIMLMGLNTSIGDGDFVTVNFKTKKGKRFPVKAMARSAPCPHGCCDP